MAAIEIEGLGQVLGKLEVMCDTENVQQALKKACAYVEGEAKKKAPKDTGELRRSITYEVEGTTGVIFTPLDYAPYVEYGTGLFAEEEGRKTPWTYRDEKTGEFIHTKGQHPEPFMRPALEENRETVKDILKGGIVNGK